MESYDRQRRNLIAISLLIIIYILANGQIKLVFGVTHLDKSVLLFYQRLSVPYYLIGSNY